ncbi:hypothetical protein HZA73_11470 [candidate division TA06 bacterium]|nr:hypothetical protein [candidate division TA06 bacterium]
MKQIKIIRISSLPENDHEVVRIKGLWGGCLDISGKGRKIKKTQVSAKGAGEIKAYLPQFVKSVMLEPGGLIFNSPAEIPFQVFILDRGNKVVKVHSPELIGDSNLWHCNLSSMNITKMRKIIIKKGGKST